MPELPEVETCKRGLEQHLLNTEVANVIIRQKKLRYPVTPQLKKSLIGSHFINIARRAKYLLLHTNQGDVIVHLGMSGRLHLLTEITPAQTHDHIDVILANNQLLRYTDPRRFGAWLWCENAYAHPLLTKLGPEPLSENFHADYLLSQLHKRKIAIKLAIMNNHIVVGVGNIYASEALFHAGILPTRAANHVSQQECKTLIHSIQQVLTQAIAAGGTTLKDFVNSEGKPGYFQQELSVYGRQGLACVSCSNAIEQITLGGRSTFYCSSCQE